MKRPRIISAIIKTSSNAKKINKRKKLEFDETILLLLESKNKHNRERVEVN